MGSAFHPMKIYIFVILENIASAFASVVHACSEKLNTLVLPLRPSGSRPPTTASCEEATWWCKDTKRQKDREREIYILWQKEKQTNSPDKQLVCGDFLGTEVSSIANTKMAEAILTKTAILIHIFEAPHKERATRTWIYIEVLYLRGTKVLQLSKACTKVGVILFPSAFFSNKHLCQSVFITQTKSNKQTTLDRTILVGGEQFTMFTLPEI